MGANGASPAVGGDSEREPGDGVLMTRGHGYVLEVAPGELDLDRFAEAAERGRDALATGRPEDAARLLRDALSLWRGAPLAEFTYQRFAQTAIAQLEELHLGAVEERVEADLAVGHARELVAELRDLVVRHPLRERLRGQLMLALYRSGRQAEALEVYQDFRRPCLRSWGSSRGRASSSSSSRSSPATPRSASPPRLRSPARPKPAGRGLRLRPRGGNGGR
jgi:DNA-binding SARP family transcriptional activator